VKEVNMSFPTFVAQFANGETTRMSTYTALDPLDFTRGVRLSRAAMALRASRRPQLLEGSETIVSGWFELDGVKLADMPMAKESDLEKLPG
jgi:hypothetical protein